MGNTFNAYPITYWAAVRQIINRGLLGVLLLNFAAHICLSHLAEWAAGLWVFRITSYALFLGCIISIHFLARYLVRISHQSARSRYACLSSSS